MQARGYIDTTKHTKRNACFEPIPETEIAKYTQERDDHLAEARYCDRQIEYWKTRQNE
jgi:hypothetical protein